MRYLLPLLIVVGTLWLGCQNKQPVLYGEWMYYYYYGDSMIFQMDTAQLIMRKFAVSKAFEKDSVMPFERVFFYNRSEDTFFLNWAVPSDTGVVSVPSSYYVMRKLTVDSLVLAPEMGEDMLFVRHSDKWPEMSKQEMIDKYHGWRWKNSVEEQKKKLELDGE